MRNICATHKCVRSDFFFYISHVTPYFKNIFKFHQDTFFYESKSLKGKESIQFIILFLRCVTIKLSELRLPPVTASVVRLNFPWHYYVYLPHSLLSRQGHI